MLRLSAREAAISLRAGAERRPVRSYAPPYVSLYADTESRVCLRPLARDQRPRSCQLAARRRALIDPYARSAGGVEDEQNDGSSVRIGAAPHARRGGG